MKILQWVAEKWSFAIIYNNFLAMALPIGQQILRKIFSMD